MCEMHIHMLYVFRCAVYYASNDIHDPELLMLVCDPSSKSRVGAGAVRTGRFFR